MSHPTPFLRIPSKAEIAIGTELDADSYPIHLMKKYFPDRDFKVILPEEVSRLKGESPSNYGGLFYLIETKNHSSFHDQPSNDGNDLVEDGFIMKTRMEEGRPILILRGGGRPGLIYAINELGKKEMATQPDGDIVIPEINIRQEPSLPYRLFWTWDHSTNWYLEQVGLQEIGAMNYYSKPSEGFLEDYCRLVDFMSMNRIGGVTIYGFLRDSHGGIEAAQELCRYAHDRGVRILPGVGINAYGGIYWEGNHKYNLSQWLRQHPKLKAVLGAPAAFSIPDIPPLWFPENQYTDTACPSKPENAQYHEEAIAWLAETFMIGGINFETGDYGVCQCDECMRRRKENSTWSFRDMALLYPRLFSAAQHHRQNLWLVSEAYWDNILNRQAIQSLEELPDEAIYQFCFNRSYWPQLKTGLTKDYVKNLPRSKNILRSHMGSQWNRERYELVADRFAEMMQLAFKSGMKGATIFGEVSTLSVVNEVNYLAFARFGYQPTLTWENFIEKDLGPLFGGKLATEVYLRLLTVPSQKAILDQAIGEAREMSRSLSGEQYRRWIWLQNRLMQKKAMTVD
ncbi:MAG: hypothetical protein GX428_10235 [Candidatus Atribacteria bacterium]|nr:hypothetical protein [Candidatus Atribacteria bacterium]